MDDGLYVLRGNGSLNLVNVNSLQSRILEKSDITLKEKCERLIEEYERQLSYIETLEAEIPEEVVEPTLVLNFSCNYSCSYCYQRNMKSILSYMEPSDILKINDFYKKYYAHYQKEYCFGEITIIGGEPLLPENRKIIEAISENWSENRLVLSTNGTYLKEYIPFLSKRKCRIKLSIDGTKEMHLKKRYTKDESAFDRTLEGLQLLREHEIDTTVLSVFHWEFGEQYSEFFDMLEKYGWLKERYLNVAFLLECGTGCDDYTVEDLVQNLEVFKKLKQKDKRVKFVNAKKLVPGCSELLRAMWQAEKKHSYNPYKCKNLAVPSYSFFPNGEIHICICMSDKEESIGRYKPDLEIDFDKIEMFRKRRIDTFTECRECTKRVFCGGGCVATGLKYKGQPDKNYCGVWSNPIFLKYIEEVM